MTTTIAAPLDDADLADDAEMVALVRELAAIHDATVALSQRLAAVNVRIAQAESRAAVHSAARLADELGRGLDAVSYRW